MENSEAILLCQQYACTDISSCTRFPSSIPF